MADTPHRTARLLFAALSALAVLGTAPPEEDDDLAPEQPEQAVVQNMFFVNEGNFDQWVFSGLGNAAAGRTRIDAMLALKVDEADRACALTDAQKARLRLLGRGDVKRLFERVEEKRKQFQLVRSDQQKFQNFYQEIQPLQQAFQSGPFDEASFFARGVKGVLDDGQAARYEAALDERRRFRYRAKLDLVATLIDNTVGLTAPQRKALRDLLAQEVRPPRRFSAYDYTVVMYQLAKLPESRVKAVFNDAQWRIIGPQFAQFKNMEQMLVKNGVLPAEPAGPADRAANAPADPKREK